MKKCCKCKEEKELNMYGKLKSSPDGLRYDCNECRKKYREQNKANIKKKQDEYYEANKEALNAKSRKYRMDNLESVKEQKRQYRNRPEIKQHIKEKNHEYLPVKKQKIKEKRVNNPEFRLSEILRSKVHKMVKGSETSYKDLIGCDSAWFRKWIEYRFDEHMNWNNLGTYWQIDHILPISKFNHKNPNESKICYHWTNLQPLHKTENRIKTNNIQLHYYFNNLVSVIRFNSIHKEFLGYQALRESLMWLRYELRYGNNATYDEDQKSSEIGNPHPSAYSRYDKTMAKVQRLNGNGSEKSNQLL